MARSSISIGGVSRSPAARPVRRRGLPRARHAQQPGIHLPPELGQVKMDLGDPCGLGLPGDYRPRNEAPRLLDQKVDLPPLVVDEPVLFYAVEGVQLQLP